MLKRFKKNGQSTAEYIAFIMLILIAFFVAQKYITRGFSGRWKSVGDSMGQGRIYDANKSKECAYDYLYLNVWYDAECYDRSCEDACLRATKNPATCEACIQSCRDPLCDI